MMLSAIMCSVLPKKEKSEKAFISSTDMSHTSAMFLPPTVTASASFLSLLPRQQGHSEVRM